MKIRILSLSGALLLAFASWLAFLRGPAIEPNPRLLKPAQPLPEGRNLSTQEPFASTLKVEPEIKSEEPIAEPDLVLAPKLELQSGVLAWERRVERVREAGSLSDRAKALALLSMLNSLPEEGLSRTAQAAVDGLRDQDYAVAGAMVTNVQTHGQVLEVLFADLLERPDPITLPTLLQIAQVPNHPYGASAQANLELLVGKNLGRDWGAWKLAIDQILVRPRPPALKTVQ